MLIVWQSAVQNMWGEAFWNPYDLMNSILDHSYSSKSRAGVFFASLAFAFATLGTSVACNIVRKSITRRSQGFKLNRFSVRGRCDLSASSIHQHRQRPIHVSHYCICYHPLVSQFNYTRAETVQAYPHICAYILELLGRVFDLPGLGRLDHGRRLLFGSTR